LETTVTLSAGSPAKRTFGVKVEATKSADWKLVPVRVSVPAETDLATEATDGMIVLVEYMHEDDAEQGVIVVPTLTLKGAVAARVIVFVRHLRTP